MMASLAGARRHDAGFRHGLLSGLLSLGLFAMPAVLAALGLASAARLAYPACVTLVAAVLSRRDPPAFVAFLLWTLLLTTGLRHDVEWYSGYSQSDPMMLAPYLAVLMTAPVVVLHIFTLRRHAVIVLVMFLTVLAGLGISLETGDVQQPLLTALRWLSPPCVAIYVVANARVLADIRESVYRVFTIALPAVSLYGIVQFVDIAPWDAYYMLQAKIPAFGWPAPFLVRVFATMNSPGSLAALLGTGALLVLPRVRGLGWAGILLTFIALYLTRQRAALGAFVVAFLVLAVTSRHAVLRANLLKLAMALLVAFAALLSVPGANKKVTGTFISSVSHLSHDDSAQQRMAQYDVFPALLDSQIFGRGLGWSANPADMTLGVTIPVDSGIIDTFLSLGLVGGLIFFGMFAVLVLQGGRIAARDPAPAAQAEFAAVIFGVSQLPFGSQHTSEHGIFLFLALGLLLARAVPCSSVSLHRAEEAAFVPDRHRIGGPVGQA